VIGVLSRPGIGSRFTVFLPLRQGAPLSLRPLILPLGSDAGKVEELQMQISGIDEEFPDGSGRGGLSADRLTEYLEQHPEVDVVLLFHPATGGDPASYLQVLRERHPLITTIAWGGEEKDFMGPGGERPDIHLEGPPDIGKLKEALDGLTRQRF